MVALMSQPPTRRWSRGSHGCKTGSGVCKVHGHHGSNNLKEKLLGIFETRKNDAPFFYIYIYIYNGPNYKFNEWTLLWMWEEEAPLYLKITLRVLATVFMLNKFKLKFKLDY